MIKVQCIGRRRLEVTELEDGNYEIKIILTGPEKTLATMIAEPKEFNNLREIWETKKR